MPKVFDTWTVLSNRPIEKLSENLWSVEGLMPDGKAQRRMTVARLGDGRLVIHNAIALDEPGMSELEAFGRVAAILVPSGFHRMDAAIWRKRFPAAKVYAPRGSQKRVRQVVEVDGDYRDVPSDENVRAIGLDGIKDVEGVLEVRSTDGVTLVFNDVVLNMPPLKGMGALLLAPTGRASVPRVMRLMAMKNRAALASNLHRLADTPGLARVIVGHGKTIRGDASTVLHDVARELAG